MGREGGHGDARFNGQQDGYFGEAGSDVWSGLGGEDEIYGVHPSDAAIDAGDYLCLNGGPGHDTIKDQTGSDGDRVCDGNGRDTLNVGDGDGNDIVHLGSDTYADTVTLDNGDQQRNAACPF